MKLKVTDIIEEQTPQGLKTVITISEQIPNKELDVIISVTITGVFNKKTSITKLTSIIKQFVNEKPNDLPQRKANFIKLVEDKMIAYPHKNTIKDFYEYWTEHKPLGNKMRFEKESVFDIPARFSRWISKNNPKASLDKMLPKVSKAPKEIEQSPVQAERSPEQKRQDRISLSLSAFEAYKENREFAGSPIIYDFLVKEKNIVWSQAQELQIREKVTAVIENAIWHYKMDNRISQNVVLKAGEGPKLDPVMVYKKVALKKFFSMINQLTF